MEKQWIISISREYGTGGHKIAEKLAQIFAFPVYDRELLDNVFGDEANVEEWRECDEMPAPLAFSKKFSGTKNSSEYTLAKRQFNYLRKKANEGGSFVVVGRCSEYILKDYAGLIPIFILGDEDVKVKQVMESRNFTEKEAKAALARHNRLRKRYHNSYCEGKWGDSRCYDICINSSRLGFDGTVKFLEEYIRERMKQDQNNKN